jgi:hypothetical protein
LLLLDPLLVLLVQPLLAHCQALSSLRQELPALVQVVLLVLLVVPTKQAVLAV